MVLKAARQLRFWRVLICLAIYACLVSPATGSIVDEGGDRLSIVARMPKFVTHERDSYLCMRVELPQDETFSLIGFEPMADQSQVHHMLLFGCQGEASNTEDDVWPCRMARACTGMDGVLYGWGRNAPSVSMPKRSGFTVGEKSSTNSLVLQIHYLELRREDDISGIKLLLSRLPIENAVGMAAFAASFSIPPGKKSHMVHNSCCFNGIFPAKSFASRVHTHALGRRVTLDITSPGVEKNTRVVDLDPLQPQGFYETNKTVTIHQGDILHAACEFNSESQSGVTRAGHTSADEMCNVYLMSASDITGFFMCVDGSQFFKEGSGLGLNVFPVAENHFWKPGTGFGQISGIFHSRAHRDSVWLFSRHNSVWNADTFREDHRMTKQDSYIQGNVISRVDLQTGKIVESFGSGDYILPHMLSEAPNGNIWVTDVGAHQVHKVSEGRIQMSLGRLNSPGPLQDQFCKPTEAIETREGRLFVADGYCNNRIVEYDASTGEFVRLYEIPMKGSLPHSIAYDECNSVIFIALRMKKEVIKLDLVSGDFETDSWSVSSFGQPFAVRLGMYGIPYVLTWDLDKTSHLLELSTEGSIAKSWKLPGIRAPHDFAFVPSPTFDDDPIERNISIIVTETSMTGASRAIKYIFHMGVPTTERPHTEATLEGLKDSFSHINTHDLVKVGSNRPESRDEHVAPQERTNDTLNLNHAHDFALGENTRKSEYSNNVFLFATSLTMVVLWGFLQTLGVSQRLVRN